MRGGKTAVPLSFVTHGRDVAGRRAPVSPSLPLAFRPELPRGPLSAKGGPSLTVPNRTTVKAFQKKQPLLLKPAAFHAAGGRQSGRALDRIVNACALCAPSGPVAHWLKKRKLLFFSYADDTSRVHCDIWFSYRSSILSQGRKGVKRNGRFLTNRAGCSDTLFRGGIGPLLYCTKSAILL